MVDVHSCDVMIEITAKGAVVVGANVRGSCFMGHSRVKGSAGSLFEMVEVVLGPACLLVETTWNALKPCPGLHSST